MAKIVLRTGINEKEIIEFLEELHDCKYKQLLTKKLKVMK